MYRIGAMAEELQRAPFRLPIRMLSATYNGYGYGAALYYGDLFLYPFAFLMALGMDVVWVYRFLIVSIWWATFGTAYFSLKRIGEAPKNCMLFAYFYLFSSGCVLNLCIRSAIGESLAMIFLPLVFSSFYGIVSGSWGGRKRDTSWIWLALGMTAIALSHMLSLVWCVLILAVWAFVKRKEVFREGRWTEIGKAALMTIGLTASFIFPMLEQMLYQQVQTPGNSEYQKQAFMDYGIRWMDYFIPYEVKKGLTVLMGLEWNIEVWHPGTIGLFALLLIMVFWLLGRRGRLQLPTGTKVIFFLSLFLLIALGIRPLMNVAKEGLAFMQFSWRILPLITAGLAYAGMELVKVGEGKKEAAILLVGSFLIFCFAAGPRYLYQIYVQQEDYQYIKENNPETYAKYQYAYDPNAADCLYLPAGVWGGLYEERGDVVLADREGVEIFWERENEEIFVKISHNPYEQVVLEFPLFSYKGYGARDEEGKPMEVVKTENGLVGVEAGGYTGSLTVSYEGTVLQKLSDTITVVTVLYLVLYLGFCYTRRKNDFIL